MTDGAVHLNGVDIRKMPQEQLREHLSFVQQRAWLFSGTIAENLRYGNPDADDKELWHALEIAQAKDFVEALPDQAGRFCGTGRYKLFGRTKTASLNRTCLSEKTGTLYF